MNLLNDKCQNMPEYETQTFTDPRELANQTKPIWIEHAKDRKEVGAKWEKIARKEERKHFAPRSAPRSLGAKAFLLILSGSRREMREIPSVTNDKDNVIARLTVLGYMMFVSLETSPLERRQA